VDDVRKLLSQDIDPSKSTSTIGSALQKIRDLLDAQRSDSVQASVQSALRSVTDRDGELAKVVKLTVEAAIKPLAKNVTKLSTAVIGQEMVQQALEETPEKGPWYEEEVAEILQPWAKAVGAQVEHVGGDNQPGDFVVQLTEGSTSSEPVRVVVEARAQKNKMGIQRISQDLGPKFAERKADAAVYVSKNRDGFAKEVGDWAEGICEKGPWVACTHEHLITALRFLIVQYHLKRLRESAPEVNSSAIQSQVNSIRTTLGKIKTIKTKVTGLTNTADEIAREAEQIRNDINASLSAIEEMLHVTKKQPIGVVEGPFTNISSN
jgi:prefoldin subunit 5